MVMAAGLGTRLQPFTSLFPKPLAPIFGIPSIQFGFDLLASTGVQDTLVNVHYHADTFLQQVRFLQSKSKLHFSDESQKLLGSGGALRKAKEFFVTKEGAPEPFFLLNADTLCSVMLEDVEKVHARLRHSYGVEITLVLLAKSPPGGQYREIIYDPRKLVVTNVGDKKSETTFYAGIAIIHPEAIPEALPIDEPSDFVTQILEPAIRRGKVGAYYLDNSLDPAPRAWFDLGSPEQWAEAHRRWIELLEDDDLPRAWNARVRARNHRIKPGVWSNATAKALAEVSEHWKGPAYWGALPTSFSPPDHLDRNQILYGAKPDEFGSEAGIGYLGLWKPL